MPWVKGQSGNPKGRTTQYTAVGQIREYLKKHKRDLITDIFRTIDQIDDPVDKAHALLKVMDFVYSKPKDVEVTVEHAVAIIKEAILDSGGIDATIASVAAKPVAIDVTGKLE